MREIDVGVVERSPVIFGKISPIDLMIKSEILPAAKRDQHESRAKQSRISSNDRLLQ